MSLLDIQIREHPLIPPTPRIKLRHDVPVSDAFRRDFDAWLLETFGTHDTLVMFDPNALGLGWPIGPMVVVNPGALARLVL